MYKNWNSVMCDLFKSQSLSGTLSSMRESINDELRTYTNPDHAMIPNTNFNISTPKRTPEDRAQSPNYYKIRDQSCKD